MTLSDLKPRGYHLYDVPPDFQGMPYQEWRTKMMTSQADAYRATKRAKEEFSRQKWKDKAIATPRDSYGIKGI